MLWFAHLTHSIGGNVQALPACKGSAWNGQQRLHPPKNPEKSFGDLITVSTPYSKPLCCMPWLMGSAPRQASLSWGAVCNAHL